MLWTSYTLILINIRYNLGYLHNLQGRIILRNSDIRIISYFLIRDTIRTCIFPLFALTNCATEDVYKTVGYPHVGL